MSISNKTLGNYGLAFVIAAVCLITSACVKVVFTTEPPPVVRPPIIVDQNAIEYDPSTGEVVLLDGTGKKTPKLTAEEIESRIEALEEEGYKLQSDRTLTIVKKKRCVVVFARKDVYQEFCGPLDRKLKLFRDKPNSALLPEGRNPVRYQRQAASLPSASTQLPIIGQADSTLFRSRDDFRLFDRNFNLVNVYRSTNRPIDTRKGKKTILRIRKFTSNPVCLVLTGSDGSGYITCEDVVTYVGAPHPGDRYQVNLTRVWSGMEEKSCRGGYELYIGEPRYCFEMGEYKIGQCTGSPGPISPFLWRSAIRYPFCGNRGLLLARELPELGLFIESADPDQPIIKAVRAGAPAGGAIEACADPETPYNYLETQTGTVTDKTRGERPCTQGLVEDPTMIVASLAGLAVLRDSNDDGGIGFPKNSLTLPALNRTYTGFLFRYAPSATSREYVKISFVSNNGVLMRLKVEDNSTESLGDSAHYTIALTDILQGKITSASGICHDTGTSDDGHTPKQFYMIASEREGVVVLHGFSPCEGDASLGDIELILVESSD